MRIFLAGFMGAGKTTIGRVLAARMGLPFIDLDDVIEAQAGQQIPEIFRYQGEAVFRALELKALESTAMMAGAVVATGGGALASEKNMEVALGLGLVVYLKMGRHALAERLMRSAGDRPLLRDENGQPLSAEALSARIQQMLAVREPVYERATHVVNITGLDVDAAAMAVEAALAERR